MDWSTFKPIETTQSGRDFDGFSDWDQFTPIQPKPDQGDLMRGVKESFQQLPQLGYGLIAGVGAAAESAFGEGGIATGIKKAGVKGYEEWGAKIAKDAKPSDSWDYSYDQAKQGNFGALVDWLQHGIGYVGGQALQTLATGGIGAVGGKFVAGTAAKQIAEGMVAKEAANIASTEAAKTLTTEAIAKLATANVASKFATLGQSVALGANAVGMEGGEVFGGLVSENKDRALTGSELGKAFAASLGAGALEFVGDKVGLDIMLGKSKLLKPAEFMTGKTGRLARGAIAAAGAAPIEAGTEYAQTLAEEYGKGKDPFSPESFAQARDAAALGALGGTVIGGAGGGMRGATPIAEKPPAVAADPVQPILAAGSVDDAIKAAQAAGQAWQSIAPSQPSEDVAMQRQLAQAAENLAERERIVSEREGAARSAARDARLLDVGQQWQALGITNPQDDLQAQRAGMRPTQDGPTVDLQSIAARAIPDGGTIATPSMDDGSGVGVRIGTDDGRLAAGGVDQLGELPTGPVTTNELTFPFTKNESGTVLVTGDPAQIRAAFPGLAGVTKFENGKQTGVLFGKSAAPTVIAKLEQSSVKDNAQRANTEAQAAPVEAPAPVRSDAISTKDVPGAGSATVQTVGVDERLIPVSKRKPKGGRNLRTSAYDRNPLLTFLATHGLYHKKGAKDSHKSEFSPDKQIMVMGYGPVFKQTGKRLDVLTHAAIEEGYLPKDGTEAQLRELVRRAIAGEKISPMYAHGVAEQLAEQSFAEHLAQQQEAAQNEDFDDPFAPMLDGDFVADDFAVPGYDEASDPIKLEVNALLALADDAGINEDALDSIKEDAHYATLDQSEQAYYEAYRDTIKAAIAASGRDSSADTGETGNAQGSQEGLTLTAPTRQDVIVQQDALDAEAKRKEEGGDKPLPRKEFTGDVPDMFNPQGSVFDVPTEPAAQATAILDAANVTGKERIDVLKDVKKGDITPDELKAAYPAKEDKFPSTAQGAIDAFNADDSAQAVAIMAKLKLDDLKEVGGAIGFRPQIGENAKAFRERIGTVADKLTLTARTQTAKEMKLYKRLTDLATEYDRIIGHRDRAIANGVTDSGSTAFKTFHNGEELTIDERIPLLVNELRLEQANPDYAKVSAMVKEARPAIFDAAKPGDSAKQEVKEVISDVGEKIGGARKDTAMSTGAKRKTAKEDDERPTWAKRFQIAQVAGGFDASVNGRDITGKWTISDTRTKDRFDQPKRMGDYFDSKEAAEAALPLIAVAQKHRVAPTGQKNAEGGYTYEIWRDVNDRKRVKVVDQVFDSREEAMKYMAQNATEILETNTTFGEADIPKPENTSRVGVERRTGDVNGEDFRETFGFRGVEFGNWNNQAERQEVMNAAYDGLLDLAEVLNIPPKAIGLNGDLALAFGARGKGLSGARAHYETDRVVMNLTKMNGAGALAHEWFHALDHYFARQDGKTTAEWKINKDGTRSLDVHGGEADMASGGFKRINSGVREELRDAYTRLVRSLFTKAEQYVEDTARADKFVAVSRGELEQELSKLRRELAEQKDVRYYKRNNKPASAEQLAEFDAIAAELVEGRGLGTEWKSFPGKTKYSIQSRHTNDSLEKLNEIYKAVRGRSGFNSERSGYLDALTAYMKRYDQRLQMLREANALTTKTRQVPTSFAMDAKSLDQGRGGDYWTSPHEMVARAFQGYVEDKIAANNGRSPFLNYAPENAGILTPWGAKRPFPAGEERKAMNSEFDKFIGEIKTKDTDTGVAMYSRESQQESLRQPFWSSTTVDALQAAIRELTGVASLNKLGNIVATTASEIKSTWEPLIGKSVNIESEGDAGKAQAFYDPKTKTVFLIADHIRAGDETAVLAHELMHKWGQQVLGKDGWDRLHNVIGTWANADKESDEYAVYNYAKNKVAAVGAELSNQELFPYAVEAAIKMGIQPSMTAARGTVARWLESVRQNLKVVWAKITGKPETFKAQDLVNLAFGIAQMENPEYSSVAGFRDTNEPVTKSNDVVGNQGGRSADDNTGGASKNAPTPDTSEQQQQGRPVSGMQERSMRAVSGSKEPAQSDGGAGSGLNHTSFDVFAKNFIARQPADYHEHRLEIKSAKESILRDWMDGNNDELTRTDGNREILDTLREENESLYFDEDGDFTDDGNQRFLELQDKLATKLAGEYIGEPKKKSVDFSDPAAAATLLHDYLNASGVDTNVVGGSGKSRSKYFTILKTGQNIRISDHYLPDHYINDASIEIILPKNSDDALRVLKDEAVKLANEPTAPDSGGAFSRDQINTAENALRELSKIDDMFVYPKSDKTDMAGIIADNDPGLTFKESSYGNETLYKLTIPNVKGEAKIWVRTPNPYGPSVYSMDLVDGEATNIITERPGNNPEDVPSDTEDVYIDVSDLKEGDYGALIYNIAATYAHNTGRIFIGDPNGLSDIAMRRRLENMISTAIKFGTTDHIAPHPKQVDGNPAIGVPPLEWVYGDSVGNLERMIDVSLQSSKNAGNEEISYEPNAGNFTLTTTSGEVLAGEPGASAERLPSVPGSRRKGWRTAARAAIFNALLREEGQESSGQGRRDGLLERLLSLGNQRNDTTGQIFYSRGSSGAVQGAGAVAPNTKILGETSREYTAEQLRAMKNVGFQVEVPTLKDRAQALWKDAGKKLAQGIADQFAPVKELDKSAYGLLRLAKGATGAFEAFLRGGKLKLTDGVYDFDEANKGGVVDRLLLPLQGEHHDFLRWVAANRAERLAGEGKENLFTAQDIADIKTLADGTTSFNYTIQTGPAKGRVTRDRTLIYADANRVFNEFNRNILDLAEQSGLIDGESRKLWEHEFYVPFYRVADESDGGIRGMNIKGGVVRQQAFKQLKGGKSALNADLLDNTLMNWAHLLDAAAKNRAAKATIEAAERMGVATFGNQSTLSQMATSINNKNGVVWFMDGGQKRFSLVDDPYLMTAITSLEYAGMRNPVMNAMGTMKHWLTVGVTASPFFKVRNLIRDSVQAIGTGNLSFNPAKNISEGWKLTDQKSDAYFRLLAGGGTIHFGTMMEGSEAKRVQALVESGVSDSTILNNEHKVKAFYRKFIEPGITAYNELGNRGEAINRAALYDQLRKQGLSHADASLQARDLMDFSMQGSFTTIRFLTQVVPFLNARIQGLYKLGKSAKEDPARFGTVLGAAAVMSIGLLAAYGDDDDWKKREEWDRNNFWWFKFGGTAFRIPKPFEIGAIATLAERGFELAFDKEMTNKRFMAQVATLLGDNLSMNPVPQLVKPILDVYSNKDSFSGRPIETMGMERIKSEYRFTDKTSMVARALGTANNAVTGVVGAEGLSPVQIDSMLRGYFGWLGSFIVGTSDLIARPATGQADRPSSDIWKAATGGMVSDLRDAPSRYVSQMYTQAKEIEQAYGTWKSLLKEGKTAEAQAFYSDNKESLAKYKNIEAVKRAEARLNERIKMIERSNMDADAKRELIRSVQQQKDRAARLVTT